MNYTNEDILQKLNKRINYSEVARILELDLNTIASQVIDAPEDYMEFKVFFDYGEFDTTVNGQAPGEGQGFHVTPVLLSLIGGDYSTEKKDLKYSKHNSQNRGFRIPKDMENLRTILEIYSSLNQGAVSDGIFANAFDYFNYRLSSIW